MSLQPSFTQDVSALPTHAFSYRSLTWWGIIGFMVIEGSAFALTIAAYFFLMSQEQQWAPQPWLPPGLMAGTLIGQFRFVPPIVDAMPRLEIVRKAVGRRRLREADGLVPSGRKVEPPLLARCPPEKAILDGSTQWCCGD